MLKQYITILIITILAAGCGGGEQKTEATETAHKEHTAEVELTAEQYKMAGIELGTVEMRNISGTIQASGMLDVPPQSKVTIAAPMGGFVKETQLLQGTHVTKGQVVAVMQHPDYIQLQQDYLDYTGQLEFAKADYLRQQELSKEKVNSGKTLQQSKATFLTTEAKVKGIRAKLKMLNVNITGIENGELQQTFNLLSPITGFVTKVNVNIGTYVNPVDVMFEIVNTEHLHAELTVFEKDFPGLKIGQRVLFTLSNESKPRHATIHLIGREINSDRSVQIHCHLDDEDRELIPGTFLKALIETNDSNVTSVPEEAIISYEDRAYIFQMEETDTKKPSTGQQEGFMFSMIEVQKGNSELGFTEIKLPVGFDMKKKIVVKGGYNLMAKMKNSEDEGGH